MNWRAVMIIRRGRRRGESGQAFAELALSLVFIMAAFIGFLVVGVLCADGVSNSIRAREIADDRSSDGASSRVDTSINYWDDGPDGIPFTEDDVPREGRITSADYNLFTAELKDDSGKFTFDRAAQAEPKYMKHATEFGHFDLSHFFVRAADLYKGEAYTMDPLGQHNLGGLESAVLKLFHTKGAEALDTVYMPAHKEN